MSTTDGASVIAHSLMILIPCRLLLHSFEELLLGGCIAFSKLNVRDQGSKAWELLAATWTWEVLFLGM